MSFMSASRDEPDEKGRRGVLPCPSAHSEAVSTGVRAV